MNSEMHERKVSLFGLNFDCVSLDEAADRILGYARTKYKGLVVTPNVDHVVFVAREPYLRHLYATAKVVVADGMPLVWLSRITSKIPLPERVTGADLLEKIAEKAASSGTVSIFLLGGQVGVAEQAAKSLIQRYPGLNVAGWYCPPYGFENDRNETRRIIDMVNHSDADILFVGVGSPKQEVWSNSCLKHLRCGPVIGVGAALDFSAGNIKRAPKWMRNGGLEWMWRLMWEPGRLWRRYLVGGVLFARLALNEIKKSRKGKN